MGIIVVLENFRSYNQELLGLHLMAERGLRDPGLRAER